MKRLSKLVIACLLTAISTVAVAEPPIPVDDAAITPVLLRYLFVPGDVDIYRIEIDHQLAVSGPALDQPALTTARMNIDTEQTVAGLADDGSGLISQRITASTVSISVNGVSLPADDIAQTLNGLSLTFDMTGRGVVSNTRVDDAPDQQMAQVITLLEDSIRHTTVEFPEAPVTVGQTWTQAVPVALDQPGMQFDTNIAATYTFLGHATVDGTRCAVLQSDLAVSLSGSFADAGLRTTAEGSGTGVGYSYFDVVAGKMLRGTMDIGLLTQLSAEGMEFDQSLTMTMNVTRL